MKRKLVVGDLVKKKLEKGIQDLLIKNLSPLVKHSENSSLIRPDLA